MRVISSAVLAGITLFPCAPPGLAVENAGTRERVVYSFGNGTDGQGPEGLLDVNGTLIGTTSAGGSFGGGAIFTLDPATGAETVLYSFCSQTNCTDGEVPEGSLINVKGTLYGTTNQGGTSGNGTVFAFDPSTGTETVLYSFCSQQNCTDGASPNADLIDVKGSLYGTTLFGGLNGYSSGGTVFSIDRSTGAETVLYSFCSQQNCTDGEGPDAGLIVAKGVLYGTTGGGGPSSNGTVFALDPSTGAEKVLYPFCSQQNCADGAFPYATLIDLKGVLYSTTVYGGATNNGTVFALNPSTGTETVLYSFCSQPYCPDGALPYSSLIEVDDTLYGTTVGGGTGKSQECLSFVGSTCGTVFSVNQKSGTETVLHSFCTQQNCTDGANPLNSLIRANGKLYGTTPLGGTYDGGTVFVLKKKR